MRQLFLKMRLLLKLRIKRLQATLLSMIKKRFLIFRKNIVAKDNYNNIIEADYAEYSELKKILITTGQTKITTSESYIIEAEDILFDNKNRFINSKNKSILKDLDGNQIYLENFEYLINENIFKSIGYIKIEDQKKMFTNSHKFI